MEDVTVERSQEGLSEREQRWGAAAHFSALVMLLGIPAPLGPLAVWLVKRRESRYVEAQAREALNFTLSVAVYLLVVVFLLVMAAFDGAVGSIVALALLLVVILAGSFVYSIVAGVQAANGETFRYPLTIPFVR